MATPRTSVHGLAPLAANVLSVGPVISGVAFSYSSDPYVPPDPQVAVGPNHIVEMVNLRITVWNRAGLDIESLTLNTFFQRSFKEFLSDPRIEYDAPTGRWFASILDVNVSSVLLAVSAGSDPTKGWSHASLLAAGCPDQPMLGVGPSTVVVSANVFSACAGTPTYTGAEFWIVNKSDLLAGSPPRASTFGPLANKESLHPVEIMDPAGAMYLVSVGWAVAPTTAVQVIPLIGVPPSASQGTELDLAIRTVNEPPNAPQLGTTYQVNTGDARVLDAIEHHGRLWVTFGDACTPLGTVVNQSCARVLELDPANQTVVQDFDLSDPVRGYFYPALRLDAAGNLVLAFGYSSSTEYPGLLVSVQLSTDGRNTNRTPLTVQTGSGPEDLWCPDGTSCRFGDYSGASTDPADPEAIWVAGEVGGPSGWTTTIASVGVFVPANLTLRYTVVGTGALPTNPTVTYLYRGGLTTWYLTSSYSKYPADLGSSWSVQASLAGSSSRERWMATGPTSGVANGSLTLSIPFVHEYYVSVASSQGQGGTVSSLSGWYAEGSTLHLAATPATGWLFAGWQGTGSGSYSGAAPAQDVVVSSPINETASFNPGLAVTASAGGSIAYRFANTSGVVPAASAITLSVPPGSAVHLSATADAGWQFAGWTGSGNGSASGPAGIQDLVASGPLNETATFNPGLVLVASSGGGISYSYGNVSGVVAPGSTLTLYVPSGTEVHVAAVASSGNVFTGWSGNASGTGASTSLVVRGPSNLAAGFAPAPVLSSLTLELGVGVVIAVLAVVVAWLLVRRRHRAPPTGPPQSPPQSPANSEAPAKPMPPKGPS